MFKHRLIDVMLFTKLHFAFVYYLVDLPFTLLGQAAVLQRSMDSVSMMLAARVRRGQTGKTYIVGRRSTFLTCLTGSLAVTSESVLGAVCFGQRRGRESRVRAESNA